MPKNAGIGGKKRKMGKRQPEGDRELYFKDEAQEYAQILRLLGDSRLEVQCMDGVKRMAHIRGKMRKKVWMACGDIVLVALREYEKDKCDIVHKYNEEEVRKLKQLKEIPESIKLPESESKQNEEYNDIEFLGANKDDDSDDDVPNKNKKSNKKDWPDSDSDISEEEKEVDIDNI